MDSVKKIQPQNKNEDRYRAYDELLDSQKENSARRTPPENSAEPKNNPAKKYAVLPTQTVPAGISSLRALSRKKYSSLERPLPTIPRWRRWLFRVFLCLLIFAVIGTAFILWRISSVSKKISVNNTASITDNIRSVMTPLLSAEHRPLKGEAEGRINILLLGAAGESNPGKNLTDTIMILSIDTRNNKVALLSLPRDLYVRVPAENFHTKINSLYQYGLGKNSGTDLIMQTVEDITALKLHYFLVLDFDGFRKIIDDIGGINVTVERDIFDNRYPGPNYSYETFEIKQGLHKMDGATALKYVRVRHNDPEGDFGRAKRQQQVIQATKNKIFSLRTFLNVLTMNKMLTTLENNLKTNIQLDEIDSLIWWSKQVDSQNINNAVVDAWKKDSLLKVSHVNLGGKQAFILVPRVGNYSEVEDLAKNIFTLDKLNERKKELTQEAAKITIINQSADRRLAGKVQAVLEEKLGFKSVILKPGTRAETPAKTLVIDRTGGQKIFSLDEIIKKIPASLATENNDILDLTEDSDFIITLGRDLEEIYKYEESTLDELNNAEESQEMILQ